MTIEANNNDWDLETVQVITPGDFNVGDTLPGLAAQRPWLVHFRDETTLLLAPLDRPTEWSPAHIYRRGGHVGV